MKHEGVERDIAIAEYKAKVDEGLTKEQAFRYVINKFKLNYKESYVRVFHAEAFPRFDIVKDNEYMEKCKKEHHTAKFDGKLEEDDTDFYSQIVYQGEKE